MKAKFSNINLSKCCAFLALFFVSNSAFSQLVPISLDQRVDNANIIFEGKVLSKTSFWNDAHTQIYTVNVVSVYKIFKGSTVLTQVEIITQGGTVGRDMEQVSHSLQLDIGDVGIFTAIPNTVRFTQASNLTRLKAYSGAQGFIKYDFKNHTASDPFTKYKSIAGVYPVITKRAKSTMKTIKAADYQIY